MRQDLEASAEKHGPHESRKAPVEVTVLDEENVESRTAMPEELNKYPHVVGKVPLAAWIVIFVGSAERFTYYAVVSIWQNYIQYPNGHRAVPGALGLGQAAATNISNAFFFFHFLTPMVFAVVSDTWWGRYRTLLFSLVLCLLGTLILCLTSLPVALEAGAGVGGLAASMVLIGAGVGGVKATLSPFLGDQCPVKEPQLSRGKQGALVVVDGTRTLQLLYNIFYWFTNVASLSSIPSTFLEKEYGFWTAYLLGTIGLCLAIAPLLLWKDRLVKIKPTPGTNILPKAAKTLYCAARSGFKLDHAKADYQSLYYGRTVTWSDHFVNELRSGMLACRVILSFIFFYLSINQMYNNLVSQASQMRLQGVPNDMIPSMAGIACILLGPVIQALYSLLARRRLSFGPIARIAVAFVFCAAGMGYAAGVQKLIYSKGPCYDSPLHCAASGGGKQPNDISVWVQLPVYFLLAIAEIFGFVTASEYAYSKAPKDMKTIVQAFTQLSACLGSALGMAVSPAARDPNMVILYACLAGVMGLCAGLFWLRFKKYDKAEEH